MIGSVLGGACHHAVLGLLLLAQGGPAPAHDVKAYWALVEEYQAGDSDEAVRELLGWPSTAMARATDKAAKTRTTRDAAGHKSAAPFPAAIMLHTEAGLRLNWRGDTEGATLQWRAALKLVEKPHGGEGLPAFLRAWYRAVGLFFLGICRHGDGLLLLEQAKLRFPGDPTIELALAQAYEMRGTLSGPRSDLVRAEDIYRRLLASNPEWDEVRLRLGRVLQVSARPEPALAEFGRVAGTTADPRLRYLAHLFAGDELRRRPRFEGAREELARALEAWPGGQSAALSLAALLHAEGERAGAASTLAAALAVDGEQPDPFRTYHFGDHAEQRRLLEDVKAMARKR
jgi:tetratricopeptide (TPR) repeat protein